MKIYEDVEQKSRSFTNFLFCLGIGSGAVGVIIPSYMLSFISMFMGNYDPSTWFFPIKYSVPFNSSTILGFYIKLTMYAVHGLHSYYMIILTSICYLVSCCYYINACCAHFQHMSNEVDRIISHDKEIKQEETIEVNNRLKVAIEFHIKILE